MWLTELLEKKLSLVVKLEILMGVSVKTRKLLCSPGYAFPGAVHKYYRHDQLARLSQRRLAWKTNPSFRSHHGYYALYAPLMFGLLDQHQASSNVGHTAKSPACLLHCPPLQTLTLEAMEVCQLFCFSSNCKSCFAWQSPSPCSDCHVDDPWANLQALLVRKRPILVWKQVQKKRSSML